MFLEGENPTEILSQYLERYRSETICMKLLKKRFLEKNRIDNMDVQLFGEKAKGLSFATSNGLSFYKNISGSNSSADLVSAYYAEIWFWMAEILADPEFKYTLPELQQWTEYGHGLKTHVFSSGEFPDNVLVYLPSDGFLIRYLKAKGVEVNNFQERIKSDQDGLEILKRNMGIRLSDLLLRIPELENIVTDLLDRPSKVHSVGYDVLAGAEDRKAQGVLGQGLKSQFTRLILRSRSIVNSVEKAKELGAPLVDMQPFNPRGEHDKPGVIGKFMHTSKLWQDDFRAYKSPFTKSFKWVEPIWNIPGEIRIMHFMCLYVWSILARYKPALWQRIQIGNLDHFHSVIAQHLSVTKRISPNLALARIVGEHVAVSQPGSMVSSGVTE